MSNRPVQCVPLSPLLQLDCEYRTELLAALAWQGADIGIAIDSSGPTYLYGTNSEHHVETSYRFDGASNIFFLMGQNEFRTFGPSGASSAMCTSNALDVKNSSNIHIYGVSACSWKCLGPGTQHPLVSVRDARNVSLTGMYAACRKDARGVCYMLGAKRNDSRFGLGVHHVVAADWARVGDWAEISAVGPT